MSAFLRTVAVFTQFVFLRETATFPALFKRLQLDLLIRLFSPRHNDNELNNCDKKVRSLTWGHWRLDREAYNAYIRLIYRGLGTLGTS
jgi:hypothetical protein